MGHAATVATAAIPAKAKEGFSLNFTEALCVRGRGAGRRISARLVVSEEDESNAFSSKGLVV
ncbi:MAG: hypothetical protein ACLQVL_29610 [Terriglobia bacterium]